MFISSKANDIVNLSIDKFKYYFLEYLIWLVWFRLYNWIYTIPVIAAGVVSIEGAIFQTIILSFNNKFFNIIIF